MGEQLYKDTLTEGTCTFQYTGFTGTAKEGAGSGSRNGKSNDALTFTEKRFSYENVLQLQSVPKGEGNLLFTYMHKITDNSHTSTTSEQV